MIINGQYKPSPIPEWWVYYWLHRHHHMKLNIYMAMTMSCQISQDLSLIFGVFLG